MHPFPFGVHFLPMNALFCRFSVVAGLLLVAIGCTTTPEYNRPLTQYSPTYGYRFQNLEPGENSDDLFVILTFSGGGTRASALSLGVLEKLAATQIEWNGRKCRLLDEVDVISSVSGGSFTSAYYGMFGDRIFTDFPESLYRKNNSMLIKLVLSLPNMVKQASPFYSRTDTAANQYATGQFENKTFGDLLANKKRPFIMINSTDMGIGRQFSFTQDYFDLLYSDLNSYPLGYAVAASSAFPGAFSELLLKNFAKGSDFVFPPWYKQQLDLNDRVTPQYRTASDYYAYTDPKKIYVHLSDGGVSDNLGLMPILGNLNDPSHPMGLIPVIPAAKKEQKIVIIVVNAAGRPPDTLSYRGETPGIFKILGTAGSTPMGWFTEAQLAFLRLQIQYMEGMTAPLDGTAPPPGTNAARVANGEAPRKFYFSEITFARIEEDEDRTFFQTVPTSFTLTPEAVDRLRAVGGSLLESDPAFQRLMDEIGVREETPVTTESSATE